MDEGLLLKLYQSRPVFLIIPDVRKKGINKHPIPGLSIVLCSLTPSLELPNFPSLPINGILDIKFTLVNMEMWRCSS